MSIRFGRPTNHARLERLVAELVGEVATLRERVVDLESGRSATERLVGEVRGLGQRLDSEIEKFGALARQVVTLDRKVGDCEKHTEAQRHKLVALAKSVDWEVESLRKSLEVLLAGALKRGESATSPGALRYSLSPPTET